MNPEAFFSELESRINKYDLLCHPFYKAWSEGKLTSADLREYAAEYYHHVAAFPSYLSAFHSRLKDGAMRDRKSTRLNSSHPSISYAVFCLKKKKNMRRMAFT